MTAATGTSEVVPVTRALLGDWARRVAALEQLVIEPAREATHALAAEIAVATCRRAETRGEGDEDCAARDVPGPPMSGEEHAVTTVGRGLPDPDRCGAQRQRSGGPSMPADRSATPGPPSPRPDADLIGRTSDWWAGYRAGCEAAHAERCSGVEADRNELRDELVEVQAAWEHRLHDHQTEYGRQIRALERRLRIERDGAKPASEQPVAMTFGHEYLVSEAGDGSRARRAAQPIRIQREGREQA